jgi:hypothetical protein
MNYRRASPAVSAPFLLWYIFAVAEKGLSLDRKFILLHLL